MRRFEDKIALVTGAASGIGRATAARLASEGAAVACVDVSAGPLDETVAQIAADGGRALALVCDVSDREAVFDTVRRAVEHFGRLDVLCNVAGILRADHTHELALDDWNRILAVNLTGTFLMCQAALPHLLATKGNIVNTSSTAALGSHPWMAAYAASKGAILSFTRVLAIEYVKQGLRANAICPGGIATPLHGQFQLPSGASGELLKGAIPFVPYAGPDKAAAAIAYLASDEASYVNGEELRVDGGALS
jgi:NAD(P)-dependent dehydrogenase (short-subunit alcohol dehydrogenase family)